MNKKCFKCGKIKPLSSFYKHIKMADGHLNKCKRCAISDTKTRYNNPSSRVKIIEYEKQRARDPKRRTMKLIYQRNMRLRSPGKFKARAKVSNALKSGQILRGKCEVCGDERTQAHHKDYRKYLDIMWLCRKHHMIEENKVPY